MLDYRPLSRRCLGPSRLRVGGQLWVGGSRGVLPQSTSDGTPSSSYYDQARQPQPESGRPKLEGLDTEAAAELKPDLTGPECRKSEEPAIAVEPGREQPEPCSSEAAQPEQCEPDAPPPIVADPDWEQPEALASIEPVEEAQPESSEPDAPAIIAGPEEEQPEGLAILEPEPCPPEGAQPEQWEPDAPANPEPEIAVATDEEPPAALASVAPGEEAQPEQCEPDLPTAAEPAVAVATDEEPPAALASIDAVEEALPEQCEPDAPTTAEPEVAVATDEEPPAALGSIDPVEEAQPEQCEPDDPTTAEPDVAPAALASIDPVEEAQPQPCEPDAPTTAEPDVAPAALASIDPVEEAQPEQCEPDAPANPEPEIAVATDEEPPAALASIDPVEEAQPEQCEPDAPTTAEPDVAPAALASIDPVEGAHPEQCEPDASANPEPEIAVATDEEPPAALASIQPEPCPPEPAQPQPCEPDAPTTAEPDAAPAALASIDPVEDAQLEQCEPDASANPEPQIAVATDEEPPAALASVEPVEEAEPEQCEPDTPAVAGPAVAPAALARIQPEQCRPEPSASIQPAIAIDSDERQPEALASAQIAIREPDHRGTETARPAAKASAAQAALKQTVASLNPTQTRRTRRKSSVRTSPNRSNPWLGPQTPSPSPDGFQRTRLASPCPVCGGAKAFCVESRILRCSRCDLLFIENRQVAPAGRSGVPRDPSALRTFAQDALTKAGNRIAYVGVPPQRLPNSGRLGRTFQADDLEKLQLEQFDVIVLFHTLELVPDPGGLLKTCRRLLAPGGRLISAVHNANCLRFWLQPVNWPGTTMPGQMLCYRSSTLLRLMAATGFRPTRSSSSGFVASSPNRLLAWVSAPLRFIERILGFGSVLYLQAEPDKRQSNAKMESAPMASLLAGPGREPRQKAATQHHHHKERVA